MTKVKPTSKEQLVYYLITNISLGTYDKRFLANIQTMNFTTKQPVTSNQSDLLDKITIRYRKQLAKQELSSAELIDLPWSIQPIQSLPEFTEAHISIEDNSIVVRSPYKTDFVKEFRETSYSTWNRESRCWKLPLNEFLLKNTIETVTRHYNSVHYCEQAQSIIDSINTYNTAKYWSPTLVKIKGNLYVLATNPSLEEAIADIELKIDVATFARLSFYGIEISPEIQNEILDKNKVEFAISRMPLVEHDVELLTDYLISIGADFVGMSEWLSIKHDFNKVLQDKLNTASIEYRMLDKRSQYHELNLRNYKMPVIISKWSAATFLSDSAAKTITLVNSNPIPIK
jgi:hypothetical protein